MIFYYCCNFFVYFFDYHPYNFIYNNVYKNNNKYYGNNNYKSIKKTRYFNVHMKKRFYENIGITLA